LFPEFLLEGAQDIVVRLGLEEDAAIDKDGGDTANTDSLALLGVDLDAALEAVSVEFSGKPVGIESDLTSERKKLTA
jgi:hypothetical protein